MLDHIHRRVLADNRLFFVDTVRVDTIRDWVLQERLLTPRLMQEIMAETVPYKRAGKFLDEVGVNGQSWDSLLVCLKREYPHVMEALRDSEFRERRASQPILSERGVRLNQSETDPVCPNWSLPDCEMDALDKVLSGSDCVDMASKIDPRTWRAVGIKVFKYDQVTLEQLSADYSSYSVEKYQRMILGWMQRHPELSSRRKVILAFYENDFTQELFTMTFLFPPSVPANKYQDFCKHLKRRNEFLNNKEN